MDERTTKEQKQDEELGDVVCRLSYKADQAVEIRRVSVPVVNWRMPRLPALILVTSVTFPELWGGQRDQQQQANGRKDTYQRIGKPWKPRWKYFGQLQSEYASTFFA